MRHSRRKLSPLPPPVYITLAEVKARNLKVHFDILAPADKKRVCVRQMRGFDDLPASVRHAINNAQHAWNYTVLAVNLIDSGLSAEQVVAAIQRADAAS